MVPLRIFIGYDEKEAVAYHVLAHSILRRASQPVSITPLVRSQLAQIHDRRRGPLESTDFAITRFLVPYLCDYYGVAIYMDCDMLCLTDIHSIWRDADLTSSTAVWVRKHEYVPKSAVKMDGRQQTAYPRKNWSSFMVFENSKCEALTPGYVNGATAADLHRFAWVDDRLIGALPHDWNWLVGEYPRHSAPKLLHYTLGGPWMDGYRACDHAEDWYLERAQMLSPRPEGISFPTRRDPWAAGAR